MSSHGDHSPGPLPRKDSYAFVQEEKPVMSLEGDIRILKTIDLESDGLCTRYSPDGSKVAVGLSNGVIKIFKSDTMSCIYHLADDETIKSRLPVTSLNFVQSSKSQNEILAATYASGQVKFWHVSSKKALHTIHEPRQVLASSVSNDHQRLVTVGSSEHVNIYDIHTGKKVYGCEPSPGSLVMDGHRYRVFAAKYHPIESNSFITGGWDDTIQFWDERQERSLRHISGPHICGDGLDIDSKFNHVLSASWRKQDSLQVWDFGSGKLIKTIPGDYGADSLLYSCQWMGKNHMVCGGCDTNMLKIIDKTTLATSGIVVGLPGGVYSVDYDHSRKSLSQHGHSSQDVTTLAAVVGKSVIILSNAPKS